MYIVQATKLHFRVKPDQHTVAYAQECERLAEHFRPDGNIKLAMGDTFGDGMERIRKQFEELLVRRRLQPADFYFEVSHTELGEDQTFWSPSLSYCHKYGVADGAPSRFY